MNFEDNSKKKYFPCEKCGKCCMNLHLNDRFADLHNGNGICMNLNQITNLCSIYESRPTDCNVVKTYELIFSRTMPFIEYVKKNKEVCNFL